MFKSIVGLRAADDAIEYTPHMLDELFKCSLDPIYMTKYVYINSKDDGIIRFDLRDYQKDLINTYHNNRMVISLLGRQVGKSSTTLAYLLWYAVFHKNKTIAILANKLELAKEQLENLKQMYKDMPEWLQPGVVSWAKTRIVLANGTKVICAATSTDGIRGLAINILYLDEFAFVPGHIADAFITSVFPTISSGNTTKLFITSCVTEDTYVYTPDGIKQISDFIDKSKIGGYKVPPYSVSGMRDILNNGSIMHNNGYGNTYKITTPYSKLECTGEHKIWAFKDNEFKWVKTKYLSKEDYVAIKYGDNIWGNFNYIDYTPEVDVGKWQRNYFSINTITEDFCYFMGLLISEGYICDKKDKYVTLTCGDDLSNILNKLNLKYNCYDGLHYKISSISLVKTLKYIGFDPSKKAPEKTIPKKLMSLNKNNMAALLSGIFDGDGSANLKKTKSGNKLRVSIRLSSSILIDQIRIILNNFGILSTYSTGVTPPTTKSKVYSKYYGLEICGIKAIKFFNNIGFRFTRKQDVLYKVSLNERSFTRHNHDIIPNSKPILKYLSKKYHIPLILHTGNKLKKNYARSTLLELKNNITDDYPTEIKEFFNNIQPNIIWAKITDIEESNNYTYDFSLNEISGDFWCHSVSYNGIIGHNTPNGLNQFFKMWDAAEKKKSSFVPFTIPWNAVPGRDEKWAREMIQTMGSELKFNQEFKCEFIGSVSTLIDHTFLGKWVKEAKDPLITPKLPDTIKLWQYPISQQELQAKNWEYVAVLDSGMGLYKDFTVLNIFLVKSNINAYQVAKMSSNKIPIEDFCDKSIKLLKAYHNPNLIVEAEGGAGTVAVSRFHELLEYDNLIHFDPKGRRLGLIPTHVLKEYSAIFLKAYIQKKMVKLYDIDTISEFMSFGRKTASRWAGMGDNHDDHVMTVMWLVYYLNSPYFYGNIVETNTKDILNDPSILETGEDLDKEMIAKLNLSNPEFHYKELENGAKYIGTIDISDEADEDFVREEGEDGENNNGMPSFLRK